MKLGFVTVLTFSLAFFSSGAFSTLRAQDASVPPGSEVCQCMKWMKATVPNLRTPNDGDLRKLDPAHFCAGIQEGGVGGWARSLNAANPQSSSLVHRSGTVRRLGKLTQAMPGQPGSAPQQRMDGGVTPRTCTDLPSTTIVVLAVIDSPPICDCQKPFPNSVPQGRLKIGRDAILCNLQPELRDLIMFHDVPRTNVLG